MTHNHAANDHEAVRIHQTSTAADDDTAEITTAATSTTTSTTTFLVFSEAGKPIYAPRSMQEEQLSQICGLLQAIRASLLYNKTLDLGDIQCIRSDTFIMVFMIIPSSMTLVAYTSTSCSTNSSSSASTSNSNSSDDNDSSSNNSNYYSSMETEAYLRLQLEYLFSQIIFTLTEQSIHLLQQNTSFDLRLLLGANDNFIHTILEQMNSIRGNPSSFLLNALEMFHPLSSMIRNRTSHILLQEMLATTKKNPTINHDDDDHHQETLFAFLLRGIQLITIIQPNSTFLQIHIADIQLLIHFIYRQQSTLLVADSELWVPICLPHFNSTGFLYVYIHCIDPLSQIMIALVSTNGTTEQFQMFRHMASVIQTKLGFQANIPTILEIVSNNTNTSNNNATNINSNINQDDCEPKVRYQWRRKKEDLDYVDASGDGDGIIPYVPAMDEVIEEEEDDDNNDNSNDPDWSLSQAIDYSLQIYTDIMTEYLAIANAYHFVFRLDVVIPGTDTTTNSNSTTTAPRHRHRHRTNNHKKDTNHNTGVLSQCINSPLLPPFQEPIMKRNVWNIYQRLCIRLRLGSSGTMTVLDELNTIMKNESNPINQDHYPNIGKYCPMIHLLQCPPRIQGVSVLSIGPYTYTAMNGKEFELFFITSSTIPIHQTTSQGAKLARRLLADRAQFFLDQPLTWV